MTAMPAAPQSPRSSIPPEQATPSRAPPLLDCWKPAAFSKPPVVGASFALEQIDLPDFEIDGSGEELWDGVEVEARLREYKQRRELDVVLSSFALW